MKLGEKIIWIEPSRLTPPGTTNGQSALSMHFNANGRLNENNFKIALPLTANAKQASTEKPPPSASTPSTVTSTNPKTPSPNTEEVGRRLKASRITVILIHWAGINFFWILSSIDLIDRNWNDGQHAHQHRQRSNGHHREAGLERRSSVAGKSR